VPVSVIVPVKNEEGNLSACLSHLEWADEVFVVDSNSVDRTVDIAQSRGARVVQFAWSGSWPKKKNWAIKNLPLSHDWVLIVDADERVLPELAVEIAGAISHPGDKVGFYINRRLLFMNRRIRHSGYYPSWNLRLFRRDKAIYERITEVDDTRSGDNEVHEHMLADGPVGWLAGEMLHHAYPSIESFVEKHNRYSNWEAHSRLTNPRGGIRANPFGTPLERRRWLRRLAYRLPFRPLLRFLYGYFIRLGFLDGRPGYVLCRLVALYEFLSVAKAWELDQLDDRPRPLTGVLPAHGKEPPTASQDTANAAGRDKSSS
jgi:glycosyltransferase involved in cell wall biosynthesis